MRFRYINNSGRQVDLADVPALVQAIHAGEIRSDTLLFDCTTERWAAAATHNVVRAVAASGSHTGVVSGDPHAAAPADASPARDVAPVTGTSPHGVGASTESAPMVRDTRRAAPPPAPWRRGFARVLDTALLGMIAGVVVLLPLLFILGLVGVSVESPIGRFVLVLLAGAAQVPLEAACLRRWGCTPGKALLGLLVQHADGRILSAAAAGDRSAQVWVHGMACYLPLVSLVAMARTNARLRRREAATWDDRLQLTVVRALAGPEPRVASGAPVRVRGSARGSALRWGLVGSAALVCALFVIGQRAGASSARWAGRFTGEYTLGCGASDGMTCYNGVVTLKATDDEVTLHEELSSGRTNYRTSKDCSAPIPARTPTGPLQLVLADCDSARVEWDGTAWSHGIAGRLRGADARGTSLSGGAATDDDDDAAGSSGDCDRDAAERFLSARAGSASPFGDATLVQADWQESGPCSWLVTGRVGWQDPMTSQPVTVGFHAAVSGGGGSYQLDMFNLDE